MLHLKDKYFNFQISLKIKASYVPLLFACTACQKGDRTTQKDKEKKKKQRKEKKKIAERGQRNLFFFSLGLVI